MVKMLKIGIDLDDTITHAPEFFSLLTQSVANAAEIHIITRRFPGTESQVSEELIKLGIVFHKIRITDQKSKYILAEGISIYFDDTDEYFQDLPESVKVFKIREPGNFCFETRRWIYGNKTGINIDKK